MSFVNAALSLLNRVYRVRSRSRHDIVILALCFIETQIIDEFVPNADPPVSPTRGTILVDSAINCLSLFESRDKTQNYVIGAVRRNMLRMEDEWVEAGGPNREGAAGMMADGGGYMEGLGGDGLDGEEEADDVEDITFRLTLLSLMNPQ